MIKVGTVFSGIGAVEHALERMGIDYEIKFACDNGDVDILSKKVDSNFFSIREEIAEIESISDDTYISNLSALKTQLNILTKDINNINIDYSFLRSVYEKYKESNQMNDNQKHTYQSLFLQINDGDVLEDVILTEMKLSVKLESDIKRSNLADAEKKALTKRISNDNAEYKKHIKSIKLLSEELSMLHERINTENIRKKVFSLKSLEDQKHYVDQLYAKYNSQNKVKQTYMANYDISEDDFHWNVSFFDGRHFRNQIDLFVGGSPCQSFSLVGKFMSQL